MLPISRRRRRSLLRCDSVVKIGRPTVALLPIVITVATIDRDQSSLSFFFFLFVLPPLWMLELLLPSLCTTKWWLRLDFENHHHREVVTTTLYHHWPPQGWLYVCVYFLVCVYLEIYIVKFVKAKGIMKETDNCHREVMATISCRHRPPFRVAGSRKRKLFAVFPSDLIAVLQSTHLNFCFEVKLISSNSQPPGNAE
ncbi:unnamed protein product [Lactuca saligna]|uniref:Uncharacterized protein n=1 Tax=Lactuca saligna TaxID=75948 RepID=A0AA36A325_LACSI|nr:unnamed protein product [Lactuca saligna]